jgi:hypothetical protein
MHRAIILFNIDCYELYDGKCTEREKESEGIVLGNLY